MATEIAVETQHNLIGGTLGAGVVGTDLRKPQPRGQGRPDRPLPEERQAGRRRGRRRRQGGVPGLAQHARSPPRRGAVRRRRDPEARQGEARASDDARDGQGPHRDARRRAGGDRHGLPRGGRGAAPLRVHDAVGAAQQVRHVRPPARGRLRLRDALELPDGDPGVEVHGGPDRGQHDRHQARHRHAGLGRRAREGLRGGGAAGRRLQRRHGLGRRGRGSARAASRRQGRVLHGLDRSRAPHLPGLRADLQAAPPRDGRQERDPGHGRRRRRPRRGRRGLGRVRDDRPAVHRLVAPAGPPRRVRRVPGETGGAREGAAGRQRARCQRRHGTLRVREAARDRGALRRDRQAGRGRGSCAAARN